MIADHAPAPKRGIARLPTMNLFFIGTPLQLLNAIEARDFFGFEDNHLVIVLDLHFWPKTDVFKRLIRSREWKSVHYVTLYKTTLKAPPAFIGKFAAKKLKDTFYKYHQFRNKCRLQKIARLFPSVDNLVLGNYHLDQSRHFPNLIRYKNFYLVDDGTDVLYVSHDRQKPPVPAGAAQNHNHQGSALARLRSNINESLKWNDQQVDNITYFSAYKFAVESRDRIILNDYRYFKSRLAPAVRHESCLFLGQCLVRDGYLDEDTYLRYLEGVRAHFHDEEIIYVPHPRESKTAVDHVRQRLGFVIRKFDLPVEWQLSSDPVRPVIMASFFCSALVSCATIFHEEFKLKAFYIQPRDIRKWPEFVEGTYDYFLRQMNPFIEVIRL
jgi:hypothetical protein